jgi:hypothetical protein
VCPAKDALSLKLIGSTERRYQMRGWQVAAGVGLVFFGLIGYARMTDHWQTHLPQQVFLKLVPTANQQHHPMIGENRE